MERKYFCEHGLLYQWVRFVAPWHDKAGGPYFPEKPIWEHNQDFLPVRTLTEDSEDGVKYVRAFDKEGNEAKVEFQKISETSAKAVFYYKGKIEGEFVEEITDNPKTIIATIRSVYDPNADLVIKVITKDEQNNLVTILFNFNGKEFACEYKMGSNVIPSALMDVLNEIKSYNPSIEVAALSHWLEPPLIGILYDYSNYIGCFSSWRWWEVALCLLAAVLVDSLTTVLGSVLFALINFMYILSFPRKWEVA